MTDTYQIGKAVCKDDRILYPIIRITDFTYFSGFCLNVTPVAFLIEELGTWSFVALEEGITEEIINHIPIPEKV